MSILCQRVSSSGIPIRTIDFSNAADKAPHDKMVALAGRIITLNKERADVKTDHEKNLIEWQIEPRDKQIDANTIITQSS